MQPNSFLPITEKFRPQSLNDVVGQEHLVGPNGLIRKMLEAKKLSSLIFWGPPATGKTTTAKIISNLVKADFYELSAVLEGKDRFKEITKKALENKASGLQTILFIDEIHRWNKAQQDALLPFVENGTILLIGATTENPSFSVISALLSRSRVLVFKKLTVEQIFDLLQKTALEIQKDNPKIQALDKKLQIIAENSDGDVRFALTTLDICLELNPVLSEENISLATQKSLMYDKHGEEHFNLISAVHKSLRSSNPTAGVYWVVRMLESGEDPLYVARRLLRFASEDIGNTNPNALLLANQVFEATKNLGYPECATALIQLVEYLAKSPKDNASYKALNLAQKDIQKFGSLPVPLHLRNAPTKLMKQIGYGKGYQYDHDLPNKKSDQQCLPDELEGSSYFE